MSQKNDQKDIGKKIENGVKEALFNGNWESLNSAIMDSVDSALDVAGDKLNEKFYKDFHPDAKNLSERKVNNPNQNATSAYEEKLRKEREEKRRRMQEERNRREEIRAARRNASNKNKTTTALAFPYERVGSVSSILYETGGGIGLGIVGASVVVNAIKLAVVGTVASSALPLTVVFGGLSAGLLSVGISKSKLYNKAQRYVELIGNKNYIEISTLALLANSSEKKVIKDLKKMMKKGFFPQGHLDEGNKTFILTDEVFHQYLETRENAAKAQRDSIIDTTAYEVTEEFTNLSREDAEELRQMIAEGKAYKQKVRELNDIIPGEVVSEKLFRLEGLLEEIFTRVKEHPEQMSKMHELMDYYLPTVIKIVGAYSEYDDVSEPGPDIIKAKQDIENTLDTINDALCKLLNNLFKDSVWDVTTDAQVLKTVLAQRGLADK